MPSLNPVLPPGVIGLDIGGANLKAATADGAARARAFDLWRAPERLADELHALTAGWPVPSGWAVTMTAELADCFRTKAEGVSRILDSVAAFAGTTPVHVWQTNGRFSDPIEARRHPLEVAAANWHALATWAGGLDADVGSSLLIDIGSTTSDIIPLQYGMPIPLGRTDRDRLISGELVYTGVRRTPLCALAQTVPFRGATCRVAAEWFATTLDVHLLLGDIPEDPDDTHTANNQPATRTAAHDRLARQICCDREECPLDDALELAKFFAGAQRHLLQSAITQVLDTLPRPLMTAIISGSGRFLARQLLADTPCRIIDLGEHLSPAAAEAACAVAVANLAEGRLLQQ